MKKIFFLIALIVFSCFLILFTPVACAGETIPYFTFGLDKPNTAPKELVKLQINVNQKDEIAAGFRMNISYDAEKLSFVRTETSAQIKSGTMVTNGQENPIISVYVCNTDKGYAPELSGNIISFVFQVKATAREGSTQIGARVDEVCNYQSQPLPFHSDQTLQLRVKTEEQPSDSAYLTSLVPDKGKLVPPFSPYVTEYSMNVPYNVTSVEFFAVAAERGTVKINRKTLQKMGENTLIVATVLSENKKVTSQYMITVSRDEKPPGVPKVSEVDTVPEASEAKRPASNKETVSRKGTKFSSGRSTPDKASADKAENTAAEPQNSFVPQGEVKPDSPVQRSGGDRTVYIIGNQMPTYIVGMLTAALCILIGIVLTFWLKIKQKK